MKKVGIVCCSNGQSLSYKMDIDRLVDALADVGKKAVLSDYIYVVNTYSSGTAAIRAQALMDFYKDNTIEEIYDISGGDIANELLPYLDFEVIKNSNKCFFGYSDLTTVINAIYTMTGRISYLYQVKNLVWDITGNQKKMFLTEDMYKFDYEYVQGTGMQGIVVGGNIRCFLKLAGTMYFPDVEGKILFLEAHSGMHPQITTYFAQLKQLGVFEKVNGVLLGTFTEMNNKGVEEDAVKIAREYVGDAIPIAKTNDIGHQNTSKALIIGKDYLL